jgi:hypothetical protein
MTSSLEAQLAQELHDEAEQVHERSDLAERVISRGRAVRRRRVLSAAAVGVAAIVTIAVSSALDGGPTESAPPAGPTRSASPSPSTTAKLSAAVRQFPKGAPPAVDYVVGTTAHLGGRTVALPDDWVVDDLLKVGSRWIMIVEAPGIRMVVSTTDQQDDFRVLDRHDPKGLAVDPTGRYLAWGSQNQLVSADEHLTEYDLATDTVVAQRTVNQPVQVQGWAKQGVIASYRLAPGGSPIVWNPAKDTITTVWGGAGAGPTFSAYTRKGAPRWALSDGTRGCGVMIAHPGQAARVPNCTHSMEAPAAFSADGRLLAASSDGPAVRVFDRSLADTGAAYPIPSELPVMQIVPDGTRLLVVVADSSDGSSHVLGCAGAGPCDRAADSAPHQTIVLAQPR